MKHGYHKNCSLRNCRCLNCHSAETGKERVQYVYCNYCVCLYLFLSANKGGDDSGVCRTIKMVGITYVAEFATNICRDAGYAAIASQIEIFAKLSILVVSVPVLGAFLEMVGNYL